jgi:predicted GTPase
MYNKNKKNNSALNNFSKEEVNIALVGPVGCGKSGKLVYMF